MLPLSSFSGCGHARRVVPKECEKYKVTPIKCDVDTMDVAVQGR